MTPSPASVEPAIDNSSKGLLLTYALYRLGISLIFASLFFANAGLGSNDPVLFFATVGIYLFSNIALTAAFFRGWNPQQEALLWILASDIILLQLIVSSSGGIQSGMGVLLVVSVAAGSIFLNWPRVLLVPALATLAQLGNVSLNLLDMQASTADIVASGWLGMMFFATSFTIHYLVSRMQSSERLAQQESAYAAQLQKLNSLIIERMQTGVMVINSDQSIVLCNASARSLLGINVDISNTSLAAANSRLQQQFLLWKHNGQTANPIQAYAEGPTLKLAFVPLSIGHGEDTLLFIEDLSKITQHAQQLKLASLGQLTASIAHEIRNPLGAISHAAQLLDDADCSEEDRKLQRIICEQTGRVNNIIESVLGVSRGNPADVEQFDLRSWLEKFIDDYQAGKLCEIDCEVDIANAITVSFDKGQLAQILSNLVDNGIRHSHANQQGERVLLRAGKTDEGLAWLEVVDFGKGVVEENQSHLFEPFFTTEKTGSGLGLYICRELCEANQARISYLPDSVSGGSCFKVSFAHPDRAPLASNHPTTIDTGQKVVAQ